MLGRASLARPLAGRVAASRSLSVLRKMPIGATPQVLVTALGDHRPGAVRDLTGHLLQQNVSIASSKKVMLHDSFAVLLSLWVPPEHSTPAEMVEHITSKTGKALGFTVQARLIEPVEEQVAAPVMRHLKLSCPQKPGIIKAISELLKDHDCKMTEVDADTMARGGEIWFEFESTVECGSEEIADLVKTQIDLWTESEDGRISFIFDRATTKRYTMGAV